MASGVATGSQEAVGHRSGSVAAAYTSVPLAFEPNRGQADNRVLFLARSAGRSILLTRTGATVAAAGGAPVRVAFAGSNLSAAVEGEERLPGTVSHLVGDDPSRWRAGIPTYARVRYRGLMPGADVTWYGTRTGDLEFDITLAPGRDPAGVRLTYDGATNLSFDRTGSVVVRAGATLLTQRAPHLYQDIDGARRPVEGRYQLLPGNTVGFRVGDHDPRAPLIIDPTLVHSTYLGGSGTDQGYGIAVDRAGNAYVTGYTTSRMSPDAPNSSNFPTTPGAVQPGIDGIEDVFVSKLSADGSRLLYSTYLGGSLYQSGDAIAVDDAGNAYVCGRTDSPDFPTTPGAFRRAPAKPAGFDVFIAKLNPTGTGLVYSTRLGGGGTDHGYAIAVDRSGQAYVTGRTGSVDFPTTAHAVQRRSGSGPEHAFVTKLNARGAGLIFSTYLGGSGTDVATGIGVDASGDAYVTGGTDSPDFPTTPGALQTRRRGQHDAFVSRLDASGSRLVYSTYLGGDRGLTLAYGTAVDAGGDAFIVGATTSPTFPVSAGSFQGHLGVGVHGVGNMDAFVTRMNRAGTGFIYSTYLGGTDQDVGLSVAVGQSDEAVVTGYTYSIDFPVCPDASPLTCEGAAFQPAGGGKVDAFVTRLNAAGTGLTYSTYLGGNEIDGGFGVALDGAEDIYVVGRTNSGNFPVCPTASPLTCEGVAFQPAIGGAGGGIVGEGGIGLGVGGDAFDAFITTFSAGLARLRGLGPTTWRR